MLAVSALHSSRRAQTLPGAEPQLSTFTLIADLGQALVFSVSLGLTENALRGELEGGASRRGRGRRDGYKLRVLICKYLIISCLGSTSFIPSLLEG